VSIAMLALPSFWLATLVITLPSIWWQWTPSPTYTRLLDDPVKNIRHLIPPAIILAIALSGSIMRMTRATVLETLRQDYIRTAWAKGLASRVVIIRHVLRNALIPVITLIGLQIPVIVGGTVILENIFTIPGMGRYLLEAISHRDYPIIQGVNIVIAATIILTNIIVDLCYSLLDPRIRYR
jgi:peptide/nickel transport system permease protein